jgi:hypothetical protein
MYFMRKRIACDIEPLTTSENMTPTFEVQAPRIIVIEQVVRPLDIPYFGSRSNDMRVSTAMKLGFIAGTAKWTGKSDHQCATPEAAPSSMSAPLTKRSKPKPAINGCGSSLTIVYAIVSPPAGIAL